jgi:hypothetical protein
MPGIVLAALVGEGIVTYRSVKQDGRPAMPGQLLAVSGVFVLLFFLAEYQPARFLAAALAWGFDVAALMNVLPGAVTGGTTDGSQAETIRNLFSKEGGPVPSSGPGSVGARKAGGERIG